MPCLNLYLYPSFAIVSKLIKLKLFFQQGYQGMVDGGPENIIEATWASVSGILQLVIKLKLQHFKIHNREESILNIEILKNK